MIGWWGEKKVSASFKQGQKIAHNFCINQKQGEVIPHVYGKLVWKPENIFSWGSPPPKKQWFEVCRVFLKRCVGGQQR